MTGSNSMDNLPSGEGAVVPDLDTIDVEMSRVFAPGIISNMARIGLRRAENQQTISIEEEQATEEQQ